MKSLTALPLFLMAASMAPLTSLAPLAHADSIRWFVDAVSPHNTLDYLVEAAGPPFPGYDHQIFTDLAVWYPYDVLNAISCFHPFSDCNVFYTVPPVLEYVAPTAPSGPRPADAPETATWFMCAGGLLLLLAGRRARRPRLMRPHLIRYSTGVPSMCVIPTGNSNASAVARSINGPA